MLFEWNGGQGMERKKIELLTLNLSLQVFILNSLKQWSKIKWNFTEVDVITY